MAQLSNAFQRVITSHSIFFKLNKKFPVKRKRPFAAYFRNEKSLCDIEILPKYAAIYVSIHPHQLNDTRKKLQRKANVVGFVIIKRLDGDAENFQLIQKLCSVDMDIKVFPINHAEDVVNLIVELCIHGDEKFTAYHQNIPSQSEIIKAVRLLPKVGKVKALALMERFGSTDNLKFCRGTRAFGCSTSLRIYCYVVTLFVVGVVYKSTISVVALSTVMSINRMEKRMFITDLKADFYDIIKGNQVHIMCSLEVDSITCCKLLLYVLRRNNTAYSLYPVVDPDQLLTKYTDAYQKAKYFIFVNCGATVDINELLLLRKDKIIFVLDSHRPFNLENVYSTNIHLLINSEEMNDLSIPDPKDIYIVEDEEQHSTESPVAKQAKKDSRAEWESKRNEIMFNYYQFSSYSMSSAMLLYKLICVLSLQSNDTLWCAIIGLSSQLVQDQIGIEQYTLWSTDLSQQLRRIRLNQRDHKNLPKDCLSITFQKDLLLSLYRQWNLYDSVCYSRLTAGTLRPWTDRGLKRVREFFVRCGLPLVECKQKFHSMDKKLLDGVQAVMEENFIQQFGLNDIQYGSFVCKVLYKHVFAACDVAEAIAGLLYFDKQKSTKARFLEAMDCLNLSRTNAVYRGVQLYQAFLKAVNKDVQQMLCDGSLMSNCPVLHCRVNQDLSTLHYYKNIYGALFLAQHVQRAFISEKSRHRHKALLLILPLKNHREGILLVGIPPLSSEKTSGNPVNLFGEAFSRATQKTKCYTRQYCFESSIIEIHLDDIENFLTNLY
ncbi:Cell division control protein 45 -like protein [Trichinella spiralis]|uniref:Cell division control protein 45-like protein n=1 Tax=Trichinella spiralis TaxID=6334 RepID=A0A0V1BRV5_TRISP|nr:Cell division control protein 45 -like protein [Trichinella spiralis]